MIKLHRLGHTECSAANIHFALTRAFSETDAERMKLLCMLCILASHCELHVFINVSNLVHVHLLISAALTTEGWMHWSGLVRAAIYVTTDSCLWVFHFMSAEMPNVNNNNLQVFEGVGNHVFIVRTPLKGMFADAQESAVMVWIRGNENWLQNM